MKIKFDLAIYSLKTREHFMRILLTIFSLLLINCSHDKKTPEVKTAHFWDTEAISDIHSSSLKKLKGFITIEDLENEFKVTADISGLNPASRFEFNIHEKSVCGGPQYKAAGGVLNIPRVPHGNLESNTKGEARKVIHVSKNKVDDLSQIIGKTILIQSEGTSIACGLIQPL
jgi:Cu/Zn superoxide dismutase